MAQTIFTRIRDTLKSELNVAKSILLKDSRQAEVRANNGPNQLLRIDVKLSIVPQTILTMDLRQDEVRVN